MILSEFPFKLIFNFDHDEYDDKYEYDDDKKKNL